MIELAPLQNWPGIRHGISEVQDGNMSFRWGDHAEVLRNRLNLFKHLHVDAADVRHVGGFHNADVRIVREAGGDPDILYPDPAPIPDAILTNVPDMFLFLLIGDCIPLILFAPKKKILGLAHASRINANSDFLAKIIRAFDHEFGVHPEEIHAVFGPSIQKQSYVFTAAEVAERNIAWPGYMNPRSDGKISVDLPGYVRSRLGACGVPPDQICLSDMDTASDARFFSHYRAGASARTASPEREGRFVTLVGMVK